MPGSCTKKMLLIAVRFHDDRYHGSGPWPPSPARLFQALVAGAGLRGPLDGSVVRALSWLESLQAPIVCAPPARAGQNVRLYLPNNDLDSVGGNPARIANIRGAVKHHRPRIFDEKIPLVYAWGYPADHEAEGHAATIVRLAEGIYQLGRGIDLAWGWADVLNVGQWESFADNYPGAIFRPSRHHSRTVLDCPVPGSVDSLVARKQSKRFGVRRLGRGAIQTFVQPPKSLFVPIHYNAPATYYLYDLGSADGDPSPTAVPFEQVVSLATRVRDNAVARLQRSLPGQKTEIEQVLVGRRPGENSGVPLESRVQIIPLPSIGHHFADRSVRRVLVVVPPSCPLFHKDIEWAFSGLSLALRSEPQPAASGMNGQHDYEDIVLSPISGIARDRFMGHYGIAQVTTTGHGARDFGSRRWRSVTPLALTPERVNTRARTDRGTKRGRRQTGLERRRNVQRLTHFVMQTLRHIGMPVGVEHIQVQKEPFTGRGSRAEDFATSRRFSKDRLWHLDITFTKPITGPLVMGDGRFLGLGVMEPAREK